MSDARQRVEVEHGAHEHDYRHYNDDASHHLINKLYAVRVKHGAYLVHEPCQSVPPQHCPHHDACVSHAHLERMVGDDECKLCEESHHEHYDERVGECDEKCRHSVVYQRSFAVLLANVHILHRIAPEGVDTEDEQYYARTYLQYIAIMGVADEVHDERHSKSCNEGVDEIAQASSDSCDEAEPTAFVQRALYAEPMGAETMMPIITPLQSRSTIFI